MASKVGGNPESEATEATEERKGKAVFDIVSSKAFLPVLDVDGKPTGETKIQAAVNEAGLLVAVPVDIVENEETVYAGFSVFDHKPLNKKQFASDDVYLDFQALVAETRGKKLIELAFDRRERATKLRRFGDKKTRSRVAKLERMQKQLAELQAALKADGIEL